MKCFYYLNNPECCAFFLKGGSNLKKYDYIVHIYIFISLIHKDCQLYPVFIRCNSSLYGEG